MTFLQLDRLASELAAGVSGLSRQRERLPCSVTVALPSGVDAERFQALLGERMVRAGLIGAELIFVPGEGPAQVLAVEFEKWRP